MTTDRLRALEDVNSQVEKCTSCNLCEKRTQTVFGEGNPEAKIVFCGEAPGQTEDETGRPFVGRAGKLLTNMIKNGLELEREDVYILNICKCRPPGNRTPKPEEMDTCKPFLLLQLGIIQPEVIVALGNTALGGLTGNGSGITRRCGEWEEAHDIKLMPCFHPSALLRNPKWKDPSWFALQKVKDAV